ncbi:MAG: glycosyltransferase family 2 protein, partial [Lachnospiraceae bacterium]|nr:glycosyltransferase family 2 protein [Lachnospiraceae bacterium]
IIPVYNVRDYVERCLDSIAAQTYPNMEIITVDDGSTDGSGRICDAYAARDSRVRAVHFPVNQGPSAARNEGLCRAKGAFIAFVDADDYVEPDLLDKLHANLSETGADISACGADGIDLKGGAAGVYSRREAICCLAQGVPFNHVPWGKLYATKLVRKCPFDERIFYSEDLLFLYQVLKRAERVSYLPDRLYHYTTREGSQVQSGVDEKKCTALLAHDFVCKDAAANFPEAEKDFRRLALETNRCLAMLAVKKGAAGERLFACLKRLQANTRRHFCWKALCLCPKKKDAAAVLLLYSSAAAFWGIAAAHTYIGRLGGIHR